MGTELPHVTVALCTRDRAATLRACLLSILRQELPPDVPWEVLVVDDGSRDGTEQVVRDVMASTEVPVFCFREEGVGVAAARNRAVREARGDWIAFIDDDELAKPGWLQALLEAAKDGALDCVGGDVVPSLPPGPGEPAGLTVSRFFASTSWHRSLKSMFIYDGPGTGNVLVRRQVFESVGLFNTSLALAGEDQDFFLRARAWGARIGWAPGAEVLHQVPADRLTSSFLLVRARLWGQTTSFLDRKHRGIGTALLLSGFRLGYAAVVTVPTLVLAALFRDRTRTLSALSSLEFAISYVGETFGIHRKPQRRVS